ncbi:MAG: Na+/H+ antiporter NhaC [Synergistaceae bacterium]|nr:Na+/H+ antiporter NhaC [Synergistaceae bacterium]
MEQAKEKKPSQGLAILCFVTVLGILAVGRFVFALDLHVVMLIAVITAGIFGMFFGFTWEEISRGVFDQIGRCLECLIIFMLVGAVISTFISCGAVPALIYYGLKILSPSLFLPTGFVIASLTSIATGTSWGTIGTIGIALLAIGNGLGIPAPITAGMIVGGAFFGDKMSPVSDTTNLAAGIVETNLYRHITTMMYTAIPACIISILLYTMIGLKYTSASIDFTQVNNMLAILQDHFNLNIVVMLPLLVVIGLSVKKVPAIINMLIGIFLAVAFAVIFQGTEISKALAIINQGYHIQSGMESVDSLLSRGGIQSMMWTISLVLLALSLGGILDKTKVLETIIIGITNRVKSVGGLMLAAIISSTIGLMATAVIYFTISLNGRLFKKPFEDMGLDPSMLSRATEEGGTAVDPLIPWTTSGLFISATLGVSTFEYFPYVFNSILTPIISVVFCYMGRSVLKANKGN